MESAALLALPLRQVTFCFLDVETTGLSPQLGDRICEVALLRWRDGAPLESFQTLVNPGQPISPGASAVNGITDAMVKDAPPFSQVAPGVLAGLDGAVMVCHNAPFDLGFLSVQLAELGLPGVEGPVLCTLTLARRHYCFPSNALGNLARSLGVAAEGEHRAMADVLLTRQVFDCFLRDFQEQGVKTLGELLGGQWGVGPPPLPPKPRR